MACKHLARPFLLKDAGEDGVFSGYGSVFLNEDDYGDVVEPGAFKATLGLWKSKGRLPPILWQHSAKDPIGVYTSMAEDEKGLYVEGRLLVKDDPLAARAYAHLKAGSVTGLSIGYRIPKGGAEWDPKSETYRLKQLDLAEVSLVTFPANDEAQVESVKAALAAGPKEFERFLRDAGLSRSQAKALMSGGYKALDLRDADDEDDNGKHEERRAVRVDAEAAAGAQGPVARARPPNPHWRSADATHTRRDSGRLRPHATQGARERWRISTSRRTSTNSTPR
jgi:HK97 family phage prohead protease